MSDGDRSPLGLAEVDVAHGALIRDWPRLREWLEEDRAALLEREEIREAAQEWRANGRDDGYLAHRDDRLERARALVTHPRMALNALEQAYLGASVTAELAAQRERADLAETARLESERRVAQQRVFLRIAAALIILAVSAAAIAMAYRMRAEEQRDVSLARALAAQAIGEHDRGDDQRAALLARQAWVFNKDGAAREQIGTALQATIGAPFFSTVWRDEGAPVQPLVSLALDSRGRFLAAAGQNQSTIRIWDLRNPGSQPLRLSCHGKAVSSVAFSPGADDAPSAYLASGSASGGIILWRLDNLEAVFAGLGDTASDPCAQGLERTTVQFGSSLRAVTFGRTGDDVWLIAGGCRDEETSCPSAEGILRVWNAAAPDEPRVLDVPEGEVWSVAVSEDGILAAGTCAVVSPPYNYCDKNAPATISVWENAAWTGADPSAPSVVLGGDDLGPRGGVAALAFSPDPEDGRLASGSGDRVIRLWNLDDGSAEELDGHDAEIRALAYSPDGMLLMSGSQDETVRVWDMSRGTPERAIAVLGGSEEWVRALAFARSGESELTLAATSAGGTARVWRIREAGGALISPAMLRGHDHYVRGLAFAPDGATLASSGEDGTVRLWGAAAGLDAANVSQLGDLGDADTIGDDEIKISAVAYSPGAPYLAAGDARGTVWVRPLDNADSTFTELGRHDGDQSEKPDNGVTAVAFAPDGALLASGAMDGTVRLWAPAGAALGAPLHLGDADVRALAFAPDGQTLAAAGCRLEGSGSCGFDSGFIAVWRIAPGEDWHMTGATLYRCPEGRASLQIGVVQDAPFLCGERGVASIAFGPPGLPLLATGHANGAVLLWDARQLGTASALPTPRLLGAHDGEVRGVAFSPAAENGEGVLLASGSTDQTVRLWDPVPGDPSDRAAPFEDLLERVRRLLSGQQEQGYAVAMIGGRDEFVRALAFSPREIDSESGRTLASAAADGTIRLSIADSDALATMACAKVWRNLSQAEWDRFVGPDVPYQSTCPDLPPGEGAPSDSASAGPTPTPADPS
jgi:WD40 repeat protein